MVSAPNIPVTASSIMANQKMLPAHLIMKRRNMETKSHESIKRGCAMMGVFILKNR
jgi:hypothetical protein